MTMSCLFLSVWLPVVAGEIHLSPSLPARWWYHSEALQPCSGTVLCGSWGGNCKCHSTVRKGAGLPRNTPEELDRHPALPWRTYCPAKCTTLCPFIRHEDRQSQLELVLSIYCVNILLVLLHQVIPYFVLVITCSFHEVFMYVYIPTKIIFSQSYCCVFHIYRMLWL